MLLPTHTARFWANIGAVTFGLLLFGTLGAWLGAFSIRKGALRVLTGGWLALACTYAVGRAFKTSVA